MNIRVGTYLLLLWSLIACIAHAAPDLNNLSIDIDGISYKVELKKSSFADRITLKHGASTQNSTSGIKLYQGTAPEVPNSWIAASYEDGEWQGMAFLYDKLYELKGFNFNASALSIVDNNSAVSMQAEELELKGDFDMNNMCAMPHDDMDKPDTALASIVPNAATTPTSALAVGGITEAVNVVLALDQFHTNQYGNDSVARAMRILNNVDAIYRNSLGIALNNTAIVSYNNANPIFANETDANVLLNQLRATQANVFGNSPRTLGSVLTSRNLQVGGNNGVAGIAYTNATCSNFAVSFNEDRGSFNEGLSSIILAHEMGHNFGANHDGPTPNPANAACPSRTGIMSPVVASGLNTFSSCSRTEINAHIANGSCYKQPIDIALSRFGASPPNNLTQQQIITRQVAVNNNSSNAVNNVRIDGDINNVTISKFTEATVDGQSCSLLAAGKSYRCDINSIASNSQQVITETIQTENLGTFVVSASFNSSNVNQRIDIFPGNQSISDSRTVNQTSSAPVAPSNLNASAQTSGDIALSWNDNSNNEQNFIVQRSVNGSAFTTIVNLPTNRTSHNDSYTNLQAGNSYTYRVSASNALGANLSNQSTAIALERESVVSPNNPLVPSVPANPETPAAPEAPATPEVPASPETTPTNDNENSPSEDDVGGGGGGGGGAFYFLTIFLLLARVVKKHHQP